MAKCNGKFKSSSGGCGYDLYKCGKCGNVGCTNAGNGGCSNLGWKGNVCSKCGTNQGNAMPDGKPCKRAL